MKYLRNTLAIVGLVAIIGLLIQATDIDPINTSTPLSLQKSLAMDSGKVVKDYNVYALPLPKKMDFAGEPVPLQNPDIRQRMDRELLVNTYWQSNGLLLIKRAHKYFPIIEPILKKNGVPDDFKYLAVAESGLQQIVSPAGATGFWQLMKGSGKELGLEINANVDERYNIEKATQAACDYLKESKNKFGSWTLAAAAYNAGNRGISHQQERQDVHDYYDLLLGIETSRYVFRIIALKEILSHPYKYGFNYSSKDLYHLVPTHTVKIDTAVSDFARFAKHFNINYKILKIHNTWLREAHLNNKSHKVYAIKIPDEGYYTYKP